MMKIDWKDRLTAQIKIELSTNSQLTLTDTKDETDNLLSVNVSTELVDSFKNNIESFPPTLDAATVESINNKCAEWDRIGRATANKFKWCEASL